MYELFLTKLKIYKLQVILNIPADGSFFSPEKHKFVIITLLRIFKNAYPNFSESLPFFADCPLTANVYNKYINSGFSSLKRENTLKFLFKNWFFRQSAWYSYNPDRSANWKLVQ